MDFDEFTSRLLELGLNIPGGTLRRWVSEGIVTPPMRYKRGKGSGKGRAMIWPEIAIEEVCAISSIRKSEITPKLPSASLIKKIQQHAEEVYQCPTLILELPNVTNPKQFETMTYESVKMTLEFAEDVGPFIKLWTIAIEKARHRWPLTQPAKVIFTWSEKKNSDDFLGWTRELSPIQLEASEKDELIFIVEGEDARKKMWNAFQLFLTLTQVILEVSGTHGSDMFLREARWPLCLKVGDLSPNLAPQDYNLEDVPTRLRAREQELWQNLIQAFTSKDSSELNSLKQIFENLDKLQERYMLQLEEYKRRGMLHKKQE